VNPKPDNRPAHAIAALFALTMTGACAARPALAPPPTWSFAPEMVFPADRSLARAEDGVALPDGHLIVADRVHGLRRLAPDGSSRPFGDLAGAGFAHAPPARHGAPNGVSMEPDGDHLLVADVLGGGIYRVDIATQATTLVYRHRYGVNSAVRDTSGAIWFTQSAHNTEAQGEMGMFRPLDAPTAEGALWRLPFESDRFAGEAVLVADGLAYANGLVVDEPRRKPFLCELGADRVLEFPLDVATGTVGRATTLLELPTPDNIERDADGRLWVVSPIQNQVVVVDPDSGTAHTVFREQSAAQAEIVAEWARRGASATPRIELLTPALHAPLPGMVTGVILGAPDGTVYVTGLGNALLRLPAAERSMAELRTFATDYAAAWSSQDPHRLAAFYAASGALTVNNNPPATGRAAIAAKAAEFMAAFPDMHVAMDFVRREDGCVVFGWIWTGTNTGPGGTGRSVDLRGQERWTLSPGGRIALSRGQYDEAEYARQIGGGPDVGDDSRDS